MGVIDHLRGEARENESIYYIYVVDGKCTLIGVISLRDLILSQPETPVAEITERDVVTVDPDDDQEKVADLMSKYDLLALPVVDETGCILGMVTVDDALDVMEEESAEDLALATGSIRRFDATGIWSWVGHKSPWVTVWIVLGVGGALLMSVFTRLLSGFVVAAFFIPLILRLSEDISGHSLALLIEGPGEERPSFLGQLGIDLAVGAGLGGLSGLVVFAILQLLRQDLSTAVVLALAVGLTIVAMAALTAVVPWIAVKRGGTGYRVTSTLISTGVAAAGLLVYLGLTTVLLRVVHL
jgi:magnesium transporter